MQNDATPILELRSVSKSFGGVQALSDISLGIKPGQICGLIGPNGAGKSTLLGLIAGSVFPNEGEVVFRGQDVTRLPMYRRARIGIARTFQLAHTFESMSVAENIMVGADDHRRQNVFQALTGLPRKRRSADGSHDLNAVMDLIGVRGLADLPASRLTFGQLRMVATGRAIAAKPKLLLLDEPAAGLSGKDIDALAKAVRDVRAHGTTVVIVEHNMDLIMRLCDHIVVIHLGQKIGEGNPEQVRQIERVVEAYLGS
jgi:branched-chain amino acid transport system ATP-binding protein